MKFNNYKTLNIMFGTQKKCSPNELAGFYNELLTTLTDKKEVEKVLYSLEKHEKAMQLVSQARKEVGGKLTQTTKKQAIKYIRETENTNSVKRIACNVIDGVDISIKVWTGYEIIAEENGENTILSLVPVSVGGDGVFKSEPMEIKKVPSKNKDLKITIEDFKDKRFSNIFNRIEKGLSKLEDKRLENTNEPVQNLLLAITNELKESVESTAKYFKETERLDKVNLNTVK